MKIKILAVGKRDRGWVSEAEADYLARLQPFAKLAFEFVAPEDEHKFGVEGVRTREAEKMLKKIPHSAFVVACDARGTALDSLGFARKFDELKMRGEEIYFLIGGSHGLTESVLARANFKLSFSRMIFPHELFRVLLFEQIYRAFMILAGRKYHK